VHALSSLDTVNGRAPIGGARAQKNRRGFPAGLDAILEDMLSYIIFVS
jgi:hypothetical protein